MNLYYLFLVIFIYNSCAEVDSRKPKLRHGIVLVEGHQSRISHQIKLTAISRGQNIYRQHCLSCHGEKGLGDGPKAYTQEKKPANLKALVAKTPNFSFFMSISEWQGSMPGWKEQFSAEEREDLVSYLKNFNQAETLAD